MRRSHHPDSNPEHTCAHRVPSPRRSRPRSRSGRLVASPDSPRPAAPRVQSAERRHHRGLRRGRQRKRALQRRLRRAVNPTGAPVSLTGKYIHYRSGTGGSGGSTFALSGSVPANGNYLIQMSAVGAVGAALPTPDAGPAGFAMAAAGGQVFLLDNATAIATNGDMAGAAGIIDMVGVQAPPASRERRQLSAGTRNQPPSTAPRPTRTATRRTSIVPHRRPERIRGRRPRRRRRRRGDRQEPSRSTRRSPPSRSPRRVAPGPTSGPPPASRRPDARPGHR